jgi:hypothetical protein
MAKKPDKHHAGRDRAGSRPVIVRVTWVQLQNQSSRAAVNSISLGRVCIAHTHLLNLSQKASVQELFLAPSGLFSVIEPTKISSKTRKSLPD